MSPWFHERAVVVRIALAAESSVFEHAGWAGKHGRTAPRGIDPFLQHDWKRNFSVATEWLRRLWLRHGVGALIQIQSVSWVSVAAGDRGEPARCGARHTMSVAADKKTQCDFAGMRFVCIQCLLQLAGRDAPTAKNPSSVLSMCNVYILILD